MNLEVVTLYVSSLSFNFNILKVLTQSLTIPESHFLSFWNHPTTFTIFSTLINFFNFSSYLITLTFLYKSFTKNPSLRPFNFFFTVLFLNTIRHRCLLIERSHWKYRLFFYTIRAWKKNNKKHFLKSGNSIVGLSLHLP